MPPSLEELVDPLLKKHLFVTISEPTGPELPLEILIEHLQFVSKLEDEGVLFAAGPFCDVDGNPGKTGMLILRATDRGDAEAIMAEDPFHRTGTRTFTMREWQLNEGAVNVGVRLSNGTFRFD